MAQRSDLRERGGENIVDSIMLLPVEWLPLDVRRWDSMLTLLFALRPKSESYDLGCARRMLALTFRGNQNHKSYST